ncbi:MAG: hypothetical protein HQM08_15980 [Candidatus Riflebacteria bacterium]|nr:hypothetical protein [Candidatus Riflebacteria bacterium]
MKKVFAFCFLFSFVLFAHASFGLNTSGFVSQNGSFLTDGPVVFGIVRFQSAYPKLVIGYKKSGMFGNMSKINVVFRFCTNGRVPPSNMGMSYGKNTSGQSFGRKHGEFYELREVLSREWNDTGLLAEFPLTNFIPACDIDSGSYLDKFQVSFEVNGKWDSRFGQNYCFSQDDFGNSQLRFTDDRAPWNPSISVPMWNYIVDLMKK